MALYLGQPWWASAKTHKNINLVYHFHSRQIPYKHFQIPFRASRYTSEV